MFPKAWKHPKLSNHVLPAKHAREGPHKWTLRILKYYAPARHAKEGPHGRTLKILKCFTPAKHVHEGPHRKTVRTGEHEKNKTNHSSSPKPFQKVLIRWEKHFAALEKLFPWVSPDMIFVILDCQIFTEANQPSLWSAGIGPTQLRSARHSSPALGFSLIFPNASPKIDFWKKKKSSESTARRPFSRAAAHLRTACKRVGKPIGKLSKNQVFWRKIKINHLQHNAE